MPEEKTIQDAEDYLAKRKALREKRKKEGTRDIGQRSAVDVVMDVLPDELPEVPFPEPEELSDVYQPFRMLGNIPQNISNMLASPLVGAKQVYENLDDYKEITRSYFEEIGKDYAATGMLQSGNPELAQETSDLGLLENGNSPAQAFTQGIMDNTLNAIKNPRKTIVDNPVDAMIGGAAATNVMRRMKGMPAVTNMLPDMAATALRTGEDVVEWLGGQAERVLTGADSDVFSIAYRAGKQGKHSPDFVVYDMARQAQSRPKDIADYILEAQDRVKTEKDEVYKQRLSQLKIKDGKKLSNVEIFTELVDVLDERGMEIYVDPKKAKQLKQLKGHPHFVELRPKVEGKSLPFRKSENKAIEEQLSSFILSIRYNLNDIETLDELKKSFGSMLNSKRKNKPLQRFKNDLMDKIRTHLNDRVEGYEEMTSEFHQESKLMEAMSESFKTGSTDRERILAMTRVMRGNKIPSSVANEILDKIDNRYNMNLREAIAGLESSDWQPRGLLGRAAGISFLTVLDPKMLILLPLASPRSAGMLLSNLGIYSGKLEKALGHLYDFAKKHDAFIEGATYADVAKMAAMTAPEIEQHKALLKKRAELRNVLENSNIPNEMREQLAQQAVADATEVF